MLTTEQAQARVTELQNEAATIEAALRELEQQKTAHDEATDSAFVAAERQPSRDNDRAATQATSHGNLLKEQIRRKRSALAAVKEDLVTAKATVDYAKKAAHVVKMEEVHQRIIGICGELDKNTSDVAVWAKLKDAMTESRHAWYIVRRADQGHVDDIYVNLRVILNRVHETYQIRLDRALNPTIQRGNEIKYPTVGSAADLPFAEKTLAHLRRIHINEVASLHPDVVAVTTPALEAVPA